MKKLLLLLFGLTLSLQIFAQGESQTFTLWGDDRGARFSVDVFVRTVGNNQNPRFQFRVDHNSAKFHTIEYRNKSYTDNEVRNIVYVQEGKDFPYEFNAQVKVRIESGVSTGFCETSSNHRSNAYWVRSDVWTTIPIEDSYLQNCLQNKASNTWIEYGRTTYNGHISYEGIVLETIETELDVPRLRETLRLYQNEHGGTEEAREILDQYCNRNYESESALRTALAKVDQALANNISTQWIKDALVRCRANLQEQLNEMGRPPEDYSANGQYNKYVQLGRDAEANGNYQLAINYYKEALKYKDDYFLRQRIAELEPQANTQAVAAGAVTFAMGMEEAFGDLPTGRIRYGTYVSSISYMGTDMYRTDGLPGVEMSGISGYAAYDHNFWLDKNAYTGIHFGVDGFLSTPWDNYIDNAGTDDEWTFSLDNYWTLGGYVGFNLYGYFEIDYYIRGLAIEGRRFGEDADLNDSYSVGFGGPVHYDGGLRSALYLVRNKEFFIRAVGWWVDNTDDSPIGFLDFTNNTDIRTQSMGYRLEIVSRPWCFAFYHQVDSYYPYNNSLNIGIDTWGIGLAFGAGTDY